MCATGLVEKPRTMGRKKGERKTGMIRAYEEFIKNLNEASSERQMTSAEFLEKIITPCVDKAHIDHIESQYKKLKGKS